MKPPICDLGREDKSERGGARARWFNERRRMLHWLDASRTARWRHEAAGARQAPSRSSGMGFWWVKGKTKQTQ